jgi:hypothetical protein
MAIRLNKEQRGKYQVRAVDMRLSGASYGKISREFDISRSTAHALVMDAMKDAKPLSEEERTVLREIEVGIVEEIRSRALESFEKSCQDAESTRTTVKEGILVPASKDIKSEREKQGHGGELQRNRRDIWEESSDPERLAESELGGSEGIDVFGEDGPPPGYYYDPETEEDTTPEKQAEMRAAALAEKSGGAAQVGAEKLIILERVTAHTKTGQSGNPAFLARAIDASARIAALQGLDTTKEEKTENADGEILVFGLPIIPITGAVAPPPPPLNHEGWGR